MKSKPVVPRAAALRNVDEAITYYVREAGAKVALSFIDALERAYRKISKLPASGSPRYAQELDIPGIRLSPLKKFPHLIFYVERDDYIDVWRVLHAQRDIPTRLTGENE